MAEQKHGDYRLTIEIAIAIVLAIVTALAIPWIAGLGAEEGANLAERAEFYIVPLQMGGEIFLRVLKMLVVPLVIASVMTGIFGMGDVRKLGIPGGATVLYYISTTFLAVVVGLVVVNIMRPGVGAINEEERTALEQKSDPVKSKIYAKLGEDVGASDKEIASAFGDEEFADDQQPSMGTIFENLVLMLFTDNLIKAAVNMDLLPLIVFSIAFAGLLTTMGTRVDTIISFTKQMNEALMKFVLLVMRFAPIGIFCLVAGRFGEANASGTFLSELQKTGSYTMTVLLGLGIHAFVTIPAILYFFTKRNPYRFMIQMSQALLTAFSTASSSATLPVTMESAQDEAGISRKSVDFVLPLGATINMDGTALYEAVAAIFIAQVIGADMSLAEQMIVAVTATLAAIGAAGIPEAGLVTMVIVLTSVGLPTEYMSLILAVDWFLDRFRTTVNVFGDACGAAVVERAFNGNEQLIAESSS